MRIRTALVALTGIAGIMATATPAEAASAVQIYRVYYDSPGTDTRSNSSLNAEYVVLKNTSRSGHSVKGWTLRDKSNHVYKIGTLTVGGGKYVTIHTGSGRNTASQLYWGSKAYVWNNTGDTAYLRTAGGSAADSCSWGSGGASKYC
ncbi:MAG: secreted protein [Streptosporangiaceae bacterium]|jgi:hypothetical protein|nr:secreted protein [Streptosporangiaceae bacterium]